MSDLQWAAWVVAGAIMIEVIYVRIVRWRRRPRRRIFSDVVISVDGVEHRRVDRIEYTERRR